MKRIFRVVAIICSLMIVLWATIRLTGVLQDYKVFTVANEPAYKPEDYFFISKFKKPALYDFAVYTNKYADSLATIADKDHFTGTHYALRVCGVGAQTIQMKNNVLFVDGKNFDEQLNLKNQFIIKAKDFDSLIEEHDKSAADFYGETMHRTDSVVIPLDKPLVKKYQSKIKLTRYVAADTNNLPFKWMNKSNEWTLDNFGPITIPADCYFVMGDNRQNAIDSRFIGFIKASDIKGVEVFK